MLRTFWGFKLKKKLKSKLAKLPWMSMFLWKTKKRNSVGENVKVYMICSLHAHKKNLMESRVTCDQNLETFLFFGQN